MAFIPGDEKLEEKVLSDERIFEGNFMKVHRLTVQLPNGRTAGREMIRHMGASAMVALDANDCIILERQWRAPAGGAFWEIPAGKIDPGEKPFDCARRELVEEAGIKAEKWVRLGAIHNAIGYSNECIEIFLATELSETSQDLDDNEFLDIVRIPREKALEMTLNGEITDVKTIIALQWLQAWLDGRLTGAVEL